MKITKADSNIMQRLITECLLSWKRHQEMFQIREILAAPLVIAEMNASFSTKDDTCSNPD
jgi:hypothetical protein